MKELRRKKNMPHSQSILTYKHIRRAQQKKKQQKRIYQFTSIAQTFHFRIQLPSVNINTINLTDCLFG